MGVEKIEKRSGKYSNEKHHLSYLQQLHMETFSSQINDVCFHESSLNEHKKCFVNLIGAESSKHKAALHHHDFYLFRLVTFGDFKFLLASR